MVAFGNFWLANCFQVANRLPKASQLCLPGIFVNTVQVALFSRLPQQVSQQAFGRNLGMR